MTALINELSPLRLNATVLAIDDLTFTPGIAKEVFGHSGNRFGSIHVITGADHAFRFRTPFLSAYNLIGFGVLKLTSIEMLLAKFLDYIKDPGLAHFRLAGSAGLAAIDGWSVSQRGILMADVMVLPFSTTGMASPLAATSNNALLTLAAEPALHSLGPCVVDLGVGPVRLDGVNSSGARLNHGLDVEPNDGELYPRTGALLAGDPTLEAAHSDPRTLLTSLGLLGATVTTADWYYRDVTSGVIGSTGIRIRATAGRIMPGDLGARHRERARQGIVLDGLSSTDTHPFVVTTGAAVPV